MPRLREPVDRSTCCATIGMTLLFALAMLLTSCGVKVPGEASSVHRVRFDGDKVTCYVVHDAISCLRDAAP